MERVCGEVMESCVSVRRKEVNLEGLYGKDHDKENDWDCTEEGDAVEGPVVCVAREEVHQALNEMKRGKDPEPSEVSLELIAANRGV